MFTGLTGCSLVLLDGKLIAAEMLAKTGAGKVLFGMSFKMVVLTL